MKFLFRYDYFNSLDMYFPHAYSFHSIKNKVINYPMGDSCFEEERILSLYLDCFRTSKDAQDVLDMLNDKNIIEESPHTHEWFANIIGDVVNMKTVSASDNPNDVDYEPWLTLPRKEVAYALDKWRNFIQREIDPEYSEIIDTEDVYKEVD